MKGFKKELIFIILGMVFPLSLHTLKVNAGSFGAEIFCTMRDGGNDHESSWDAAYTYIKKQKGGIFKVSPKQAAAEITESVISCLLYTSPSPRDTILSRMPSSA